MKDDARVAELGAAGESESAQTLRVLENRLDKANIKCVEANHINNTYKQILTKLQDVSCAFVISTFSVQVDLINYVATIAVTSLYSIRYTRTMQSKCSQSLSDMPQKTLFRNVWSLTITWINYK